MSNLNVRVLEPPTHSRQFDANCGKIWYEWWSVPCTMARLHGCKHVLFAEQSITERDYFQILLLRILSSMEPSISFIFRYRCCDGHFPCFGKYIFPQLQTCTALVLFTDCTEGSFSSNIVFFNNFLVFNFPFFNFQQ